MDVTPEIQALIDEATAGLKSKNDQLISEKRKLQKDGAITPEQLAEVERERDQALGELTNANKALKKANTDLDNTKKTLDSESKFTQTLLIDNGIISELAKNNVTDPALLAGAQAMLRAGVQIVADGDARIAKVGDKALSEHVKEWAASDIGKRYVTAPANSGGGANGGGSATAAVNQMTRSQFDALPPGAKSEFGKKGGKLVDG